MHKVVSSPFFLVVIVTVMLTCSPIFPVCAVDEDGVIDLNNFPAKIAEAFNIPVFAGGILASLLFICPFLFPVAIFTRKNPTLPCLIVGIPLMAFCTALSWLPVWVILVLSLCIALLFGDDIKNKVSR